MKNTTLIETYDPEKDAPDFDRPLLRAESGVEFLHPPRLRAYCPGFVLQALGFASPGVTRVHRFAGVYHSPAGITIYDRNTVIETGAEEPTASRRLAILQAWTQSHPLKEALRGEEIGDGEIPSEKCSVITVDLTNGNLWVLPFEVANAVIASDLETAEWDDVTELQAVDLFYSWMSGEIE